MVCLNGETGEVGDVVVEGVVINMVDLESFGDISVVFFPYVSMEVHLSIGLTAVFKVNSV